MKVIQSVQDQFQKSKIKYTQQIADLSSKPSNIDSLFKFNILKQLTPLLLDPTVSVKNNAALTLGRMSAHSPQLAEAIVTAGVLPQLVISLAEQNIFYKKAACFVMKQVAKHSSALAKSIINSEALELLTLCLEEFDSGVKESSAMVIANIAKQFQYQPRHSEELAKLVVEAGSVEPLVLALENPEPSLKKACALALSEISKHSVQLAESVVDAGAVIVLNQLVGHHDTQLKKQVCQCLSNIAKHSQSLSETIVGAELFPKILYRLKDTDQSVRKMSAGVIREIVKQSPELAKLYVQSGGIAATIEYLNDNKDGNSTILLPGIVILGYIGAYDPTTASRIIDANGMSILKQALTKVPDDFVKSAAAWAMSQIACHSPEHTKKVCEEECLIHLLAVYLYRDSTEELKSQSEKSLKSIIKMCLVLEPLEAIIDDAPVEILKYLLKQIAKVLTKAKSAIKEQEKGALKAFVVNKGLKKIQSLESNPTIKLLIDEIIGLYPQDIVQFYSPNYQQALISKV